MEASIEHMSRGTPRHVDTMLIITEPYYRSLESTGRLAPLARELGIPQVMAIANKVRSPRDAEAIQEYCARHGIDLVASVPFDESIAEADREGRALLDLRPESSAVEAVRRITQILCPGALSVADGS